jgi:hypothetical protein
MLLVEYRLLDKVKVISESTSNGNKKFKVRGKFQKCDEQNNNGRIYPRKILESQVKELQDKIDERSLVGALDHPANDAIHLSQASHLITKLWVESNGDVMGEAEILSTPSGKIVEALLNDKVKIGISSRGLGTISEGKNGKIVNEDFKLITFDLVSDPSTKGAFPELTESVKANSAKAQKIISKLKEEQILLTSLSRKIDEAVSRSQKRRLSEAKEDRIKDYKAMGEPKGMKPIKNSGPAQVNPNFKPKSPLQKNLAKKLSKIYKDDEKKAKKNAKNDTPGQKKFKFAESVAKALKSKFDRDAKFKEIVESINSINESSTPKAKEAVKLYLLKNLQYIAESWPVDYTDSKDKSYYSMDAKSKLDVLQKIIKVIEDCF